MNLISKLALFASILGVSEAHVTANPSIAAPGSYFVTAFRVPHGCNGSPTINVTITIPNTISSVTPQVVPGWNISFGYVPSLAPIPQEDGSFVNTTIGSVSYTGNTLPANMYTDFGISFKMPLTADNNNTLYFPTYQTCVNGSNLWIGTPNSNGTAQTANPAPKIQLTNSTSSSSGTKGSNGFVISPSSTPIFALALFSLFALV
jgi:uncharacterized protein YcnI